MRLLQIPPHDAEDQIGNATTTHRAQRSAGAYMRVVFARYLARKQAKISSSFVYAVDLDIYVDVDVFK
jgi:hypothetical protein